MRRVFNKLVRDRIPEIIESRGERAVHHIADEVEYSSALVAKLHEEIAEFLTDSSLEEAADVIEVLRAILAQRGLDLDSLEALRQQKASARGAFDKRLILDYTE